MKTRTLIAAAISVMLSSPAYAWAPFTTVTSVCDTCKPEPADVVTLTTGAKIRGMVVGENSSFVVVVRNTEARAIPRVEVQSIDWVNKSKPPAVSGADQILLKNGVVLNGKITEDKAKPPVLQLRSNYLDQTYVVFKSEVAEAYRGGVRVDL